MIDKNYAGMDGFIWWMGIVESRQDPLTLGRCQVRIFNWHSPSLADIPSENLPWAHPVNSLNSGSFTTPRESDMVFGFFADGRNGQVPIIVGVVPNFPIDKGKFEGFKDLRTADQLEAAPKKPNQNAETYPLNNRLNESSLSRMAVNKTVGNTVVATRRKGIEKNIPIAGGGNWAEPFPGFNAKYPYNQVIESESGHAFELDDTPNDERVTINHRTGTADEFYPSGSKLEKITKNKYEIIMNDDFVFIKGECNITIGNDANIKINGKALVEANEMDVTVKKDFRLRAANIKIESAGKIDVKASGKINQQGSDINLKASTKVAIGAATLEVPVADIKLQSGSTGSAAASGLSAPSISTYSREEFKEPTPEVASNFAFEEPDVDAKDYINQKIEEGVYKKEDIDAGNAAKATESDTSPAKDVPPLSGDCGDIHKMTSFSPSLQLSPNFTLGNMLNCAVTRGVQIKPQHGYTEAQIVCNLKMLCINTLEPIKKLYPNMVLNSVFRNVGSSKASKSRHEMGMAADIQIPSFTKALENYYDAAIKIRDSVPHTQVLLEYTTTSSAAPGTWIHVSYEGANAPKVHLTYMNHDKYAQGFHKLKTGPAPGKLA